MDKETKNYWKEKTKKASEITWLIIAEATKDMEDNIDEARFYERVFPIILVKETMKQ